MVIQRKDSEIRRLKALLGGGGSPNKRSTTTNRMSTKVDVQQKFRKNLVAGASKARAGISAGIVQQNFQVSQAQCKLHFPTDFEIDANSIVCQKASPDLQNIRSKT